MKGIHWCLSEKGKEKEKGKGKGKQKERERERKGKEKDLFVILPGLLGFELLNA